MSNILWILFDVLIALDVVFIVVISIVSTYLLLVSHFMRLSPPVPTVGAVKTGMLAEVEDYIKNLPQAKIVDLGSGWGTLLLPLAQKYPQHTFIGYESAWLPYAVSRFRMRSLTNARIYHQDFFTADFSDIDVILCFQLASIMQNLLPYLRRHISKTVRIIVNRYPFKEQKSLKKVSEKDNFAVYYVYDLTKE